MNHPLKVYFPLAGRFYLLHWWSYNDRGHLILAKNQNSLMQTARRAFHANAKDDLEIKSMSLVEMVAPPLEMCQRAAEYQHQEEINNFLREICFKLSFAMNDGAELPEDFVKCHEYCSEWDDPDDDELEHHYSCSNCFGRVRLKSTTSKEDFYQKYHQAWYQENPRNESESKTVYSRAEPAREDEELFVALPVFGHHSAGADLYPIGKDLNERATDFFGPALFYYRKLKGLDFSEAQAMLNQIQSEYREEARQKKILAQRERDLRERQDREKVIQFFRKS